MPQLTVYKASAGSGKTFRLTIEYLKLLLENPLAYQHILAVTFTNKATAEMKERVLMALEELSNATDMPKSGMLEILGQELNINSAEIQRKAGLALSYLLHDYGRFRIETIDSFFSSILRNLARELGIGTALNIELNSNQVLDDAVKRLLDKANEHPELLSWITEYIEDRLQDGKSWKIDAQLKDFGKNMFKEVFKVKEAVLGDKLKDKQFLMNYKKLLRSIEKESLEKIKGLAEPFFKILESSGLNVRDFSNKESGPCAYFIKLQRGEGGSAILTSRVQRGMTDPTFWRTKTSAYAALIDRLATDQILPLMAETELKRVALWRDYMSAKSAGKRLNQVGLLTDIASEVHQLNNENHRFLLADTNAFLNNMIDGSDSTFIYEKTGVEIHHILFDEFQDTSRLQWETFKPLLQEALSNGYKSLIVGDEKQSIYRWRNGDWRILGHIEDEIKAVEIEVKSLNNNWRSAKNVVQFNNLIFQLLEKYFNQCHLETFEAPSIELKKAYADVAQIPMKEGIEGMVELNFIRTPKDISYENEVLKRMTKQIESLQKSGIQPHELAILIRTNKEIPMIGAFLAEYKKSDQADKNLCYDVVSDDAFLLKSSKAVQIVMNALRVLNDPTDAVKRTLLKFDYQSDVVQMQENGHALFQQEHRTPKQAKQKTVYKRTLTDFSQDAALLPEAFVEEFEALQRMPLYELIERLFQIFELSKIDAQDSYLHCFMDKLSTYLLRAPSDIESFLDYWDTDLSNQSIPSNAVVNGIRILSIHKSKGLEFHTVLIPFCDWPLTSKNTITLWCSPDSMPYNQLDIIPIDYGPNMNESIFKKDFAEETLQLWVDCLNLLYVAFTRAKFHLITFSKGLKLDSSTSKADKIGKLLHEILHTNAADLPLTCLETTDETTQVNCDTFQWGSLHIETQETASSKASRDIPIRFESRPHKTKFRQSNRSTEFCKQEDDSESTTSGYIQRGNLLHKLFQNIRTLQDIPKALNTLIQEGLISAAEADVYETYTRNALSNKQASDWYSGNYKLYNECAILCPAEDGSIQLKRPDRVMMDGDRVEIVDFKFGQEKPSHYKQVREYMQLMSGMGHSNITGYLWYVDESRLIEV